MANWRCPYCGTPQVEAARCWVCHRSSTSCATCRHFRASVAAKLGFCGLDRRRSPLRGDEQLACWDGATAPLLGRPLAEPVREPMSIGVERMPLGAASMPQGAQPMPLDVEPDPTERPVYRLWDDAQV